MRRSSLLLCGLLAAAIVVPGTVVWAATPTDEDTVEADAAMGSTGPTGFTDDIREGVPSDAGEEVGQPSEGQEDVVSQGGSKEAPASNTPAAAMPSPGLQSLPASMSMARRALTPTRARPPASP